MDSSSDDDEDLFNFKKRALHVARHNKHPITRYEENSSDESDSDDSCERSKRTRKLLKSYDDGNDEEDSDDQAVKKDINPSPKQNVLILDSDDEDAYMDNDKVNPFVQSITNTAITSIDDLCSDKETQNALMKAREARSALLQPEGDDLVTFDDDNDNAETEIFNSKREFPLDHVDEKELGSAIRLKLRTVNKSQDANVANFVMYGKESFASLFEKYKRKFNLPPTAVVKMSFDGQNLLLQATPDALGMEDDDLVDVFVSNFSPYDGFPSKSQVSKVPGSGDDGRITFVTKVKGGDPRSIHRYILKLNDPFQKLLNAYRKEHGYSTFKPVSLEYCGKQLDPDTTPAKLKMKGQVQIEVIDTEEKLKQLERCGKLLEAVSDELPCPPSSLSINKLSLKVRVVYVGEKNFTEQSFDIGHNEAFSVLIDQFCEKNNLSRIDCKFKFDGGDLSLNGTPEDEGLEGGEIIDVFVKKSPKTSSSIQPTMNASNVNGAVTGTTSLQSRGQVISLQIVRNQAGRPRKFLMNSNDLISKLTTAYGKIYRSKGCISVQFYHKGLLINDNRTIQEHGLQNMDVLNAIENGMPYNHN
jgi:hypothetical protein